MIHQLIKTASRVQCSLGIIQLRPATPVFFLQLFRKNTLTSPHYFLKFLFHFIWISKELFSCIIATASINTFYPYLCPNSVFQKCFRNGDVSITFPFLLLSFLSFFSKIEAVHSQKRTHKITGLHLCVCLYIEKIMECEMEFKLAKLALLFCW